MFKKILIAEDHQSANISVQTTLKNLNIVDARYVYYCDDALNWIKNAIRDQQPYDLLITDLGFEADHVPQHISNGTDLIHAVKEIQPDLKIIVFSAEHHPAIVDDLFQKNGIDGYVRKARRDVEHLMDALQTVYHGKAYQSPDLRRSIREGNFHEFSPLDIHIVSLLYQGTTQKNIPNYLQQKNIKPSSLSSVEKRLSLMREALGFSKNEQLVVYCKEKGLI